MTLHLSLSLHSHPSTFCILTMPRVSDTVSPVWPVAMLGEHLKRQQKTCLKWREMRWHGCWGTRQKQLKSTTGWEHLQMCFWLKVCSISSLGKHGTHLTTEMILILNLQPTAVINLPLLHYFFLWSYRQVSSGGPNRETKLNVQTFKCSFKHVPAE